MSKTTHFKKKPVPWIYSSFGAPLFTAIMKLHPFHRLLTRLEVKNIQDYFNSSLVPEGYRKSLNVIQALFMCYVCAIKRVMGLSKAARQDYFAMNRHGCFTQDSIEDTIPALADRLDDEDKRIPLLIIPGLNTPPVFFREMHEYFMKKGYLVSVLTLPDNGFADIDRATATLEEGISALKARCNADKVDVIGHCLGGIIAHHYLANQEEESIRNLISLGTGFSGAEGVQVLKDIWTSKHPEKNVPAVFDQLIQWNLSFACKTTEVYYHNFITIWDFIVHFKKGYLNQEEGSTAQLNQPGESEKETVNNYIIDDPDIDHLTMVLNPKVFQKIETVLVV
ncbi:MAG: alpha/beta hydrolase [Vampirovibrio sp.]|nr:alpha/beta hydrolase [Vampirovibrio sp.]